MSLEPIQTSPVLRPLPGSPVHNHRVISVAQTGASARLHLRAHQITLVNSGTLIASEAGTLVRPVLEPEVRMALSKAKRASTLKSYGAMAAASGLLVIMGLTAPLLGWNAGILVPLGLTAWVAVGFSVPKDLVKK